MMFEIAVDELSSLGEGRRGARQGGGGGRGADSGRGQTRGGAVCEEGRDFEEVNPEPSTLNLQL